MDYPSYVVQPGDTIYKIANAYHVDMEEIIQLNQLNHPNLIYPGQVLLLPIKEHHPKPPFMEIPEPNLTYALWLYDAYAGKDSELSAVTAYLYQAAILDKPEFDALFRPIAYDELRHLEMLGVALHRLGADPRYGAFHEGHWMDWRSRYLDYTKDLCKILEMNMRDEAEDARMYRELAQKILIPEIQEMLLQIACDEDRHCQCFSEAYHQCCPDCIPCPPVECEPEKPLPHPHPEVPFHGGAG